MTKLQTRIMLFMGLGALALLPAARADEWNQRTVMTFSSPVEIPGQILPAGTYVFKVADSQANRHIVQVFNKNENHVLVATSHQSLVLPPQNIRSRICLPKDGGSGLGPGQRRPGAFHDRRVAAAPNAASLLHERAANYGSAGGSSAG
jgi:hypothetical protein